MVEGGGELIDHQPKLSNCELSPFVFSSSSPHHLAAVRECLAASAMALTTWRIASRESKTSYRMPMKPVGLPWRRVCCRLASMLLLMVAFVADASSSPNSSHRARKPVTTKTPTQRRLEREWKDAVQQGIAFDWKRSKPVNDTQVPQHLFLGPLSTNLHVWHFTFSGMGVYRGLYHGRVIVPLTYPAEPPRIHLCTPSGRYIPFHDICLSASNYHPETWSPSAWSLRTLVESLRLHMLTPAQEIGGKSASFEERQELARLSRDWRWHHKKYVVSHTDMLRYMSLDDEDEVVATDEGVATDEVALAEGESDEMTADAVLHRTHSVQYARRTSRNLSLVRLLPIHFQLGAIAFVLLFFWLNRV